MTDAEHPVGEGYSLEPVAPRHLPDLSGVVEAPDDGEDLIDLLTADLLAQSLDCVHRFGDFHLALSTGEGLEPLFRRMMFDPDLRLFPWQRTHLWFLEERRVAREDPRSSYARMRDTLIMPAGIPLHQVHAIPGDQPKADLVLEEQLRKVLSGRLGGQGCLDGAILEVGADGRIAALFPGEESTVDSSRWVRLTGDTAGDAPGWISMTLPVINRARMIAVVAQGEAVGRALHQLADRDLAPRDFPAAGLRSDEGLLKWYLDESAARV